MPIVNAVIYYKPEDPPGFDSGVKFKITKTFDFKYLPAIEGNIILKEDAIKEIGFTDPDFDAETGEYTVFGSTSENVNRYYHGEAIDQMLPVLHRYIEHGWKFERI